MNFILVVYLSTILEADVQEVSKPVDFNRCVAFAELMSSHPSATLHGVCIEEELWKSTTDIKLAMANGELLFAGGRPVAIRPLTL